MSSASKTSPSITVAELEAGGGLRYGEYILSKEEFSYLGLSEQELECLLKKIALNKIRLKTVSAWCGRAKADTEYQVEVRRRLKVLGCCKKRPGSGVNGREARHKLYKLRIQRRKIHLQDALEAAYTLGLKPQYVGLTIDSEHHAHLKYEVRAPEESVSTLKQEGWNVVKQKPQKRRIRKKKKRGGLKIMSGGLPGLGKRK